jgi:hypothetical protein
MQRRAAGGMPAPAGSARPPTKVAAPASAARSPADPVLLSTAPHLLALAFIAGCPEKPGFPGMYLGYSLVVGASSVLSLLWHRQRERKNALFWLDYAFAYLWAAYDAAIAIIAAPVPSIITVFLLNGVCFATNMLGDWVARRGLVPYERAHSVWHLVNVTKSVFVAYLVGCRWRADCRA